MGKKARVAGLVLHILIGGMMLFGGLFKIFGPAPKEGDLPPALIDQLMLLAGGEIITACLLIIPRTSSLGVLLASGFWGGTIGFHMSRGEGYVGQASFLVLTWLGGYLRNPSLLASFTRPGGWLE